jgi:competence protein ComEA
VHDVDDETEPLGVLRASSRPRWAEGLAPILVALLAERATRWLVVAVGLAVVALAGGASWWWLTAAGGGAAASDVVAPVTVVPLSSGDGQTSTTATAELVVHAAGAIGRPGLYRLPPGSRVGDLIEAAGGLSADADADRLNLAGVLADGVRVYVPRVGEAMPGAPVGADAAPGSPGVGSGDTGGPDTPTASSVDLNTATAEQLDELPGIGPATAAAILDHRQRHGPFGSVDELLDVRGIGPAKLEALRDLVTA